MRKSIIGVDSRQEQPVEKLGVVPAVRGELEKMSNIFDYESAISLQQRTHKTNIAQHLNEVVEESEAYCQHC